MIERYVFIKLKEDHAGEASRAEVVERLRALADLEGVAGVTVGVPVDEGARAAWDVSCVVRFEHLDAVAAYVDDPSHRELVDRFLAPRMEVIKAWNFEV